MINLNPFAISGLLIVITYLPLFFFILRKGNSHLTHIYSLHIISIAIWGLASFIIGYANSLEVFLPWMKIGHASALLIPVFFIHSMRIMINNKSRKLIFISYIQAIFFIFLIFLNKMYIGLGQINNSFFYAHGSIYYLISFLIWELIIIKAHVEIFSFYKKNIPKQIFFLIFNGIGFIGGTMNVLPSIGLNIYPYGNFLIPIHSFAITYAIFKHQLLNIEIVYKKSLVYSILFGCISLFYLMIVISFEKILQHYWGYSSPTISTLTAFIIGILFIPLRNKIQNITDRFFFNASHVQMIDENELLRQEVAQNEKLKTISTFASGMAHEIKNPLTAIKTFVEYLPTKVHDPEFLKKFVPIVHKEVDRINELIHELLEYSKPSPLALKPTNIHKIITDTLDILNNQMITKKINIIREFNETELREALLDRKQIKQALLNIFINAIDALEPNGYLRITTEFQKTKLTIKITDTGCGIAKENLPYIFDPFFTKKEGGTGLGLSITHGIIKEHGGKIFAESKINRGTTFRIELPLSYLPPLI